MFVAAMSFTEIFDNILTNTLFLCDIELVEIKQCYIYSAN